MKKKIRTKKTVPYLQRLHQSQASKALAEWNQKNVLYEFDMSFVIEQVNKILEDYAEENNLKADEFTPEYVVIDAYQEQDLIIALKMSNLAVPKNWEVSIDSHFFNKNTDQIHTIPYSIELPEMSHAELMSGCKLHIPRKGGLKTRWRGLTKEMISNWKDQGIPEDFDLIQSQVYIKAQAYFHSRKAYEEHHQLLARRDEGTLIEFLKLQTRVHAAVIDALKEKESCQ